MQQIKLFSVTDLKEGIEVVPTVIVTVISKKESYINYIILGGDEDQDDSLRYIRNNHSHLLMTAQKWAKNNSQEISHQ